CTRQSSPCSLLVAQVEGEVVRPLLGHVRPKFRLLVVSRRDELLARHRPHRRIDLRPPLLAGGVDLYLLLARRHPPAVFSVLALGADLLALAVLRLEQDAPFLQRRLRLALFLPGHRAAHAHRFRPAPGRQRQQQQRETEDGPTRSRHDHPPWRRPQLSTTTSPPSRLPIAWKAVGLMPSRMKRTEPSAMHSFTPSGW